MFVFLVAAFVISLHSVSASVSIVELYDAVHLHGDIYNAASMDPNVFESAYNAPFLDTAVRLRLFFNAFIAKKGMVRECFPQEQIAVFWRNLTDNLDQTYKASVDVFDNVDLALFQHYCCDHQHTFPQPKTLWNAMIVLYIIGKCEFSASFDEYEVFCICLQHFGEDKTQVLLKRKTVVNHAIDGNAFISAALTYDNLHPLYVAAYKEIFKAANDVALLKWINSSSNSISEKAMDLFESFPINFNYMERERNALQHLNKGQRLGDAFEVAIRKRQFSALKQLLRAFAVPEMFDLLKRLSMEELYFLPDCPESRSFLEYLFERAKWSASARDSPLRTILAERLGCNELPDHAHISPLPSGFSPFDIVAEENILKRVILSSCGCGLGYFISLRLVCKKWSTLFTPLDLLKEGAAQAIGLKRLFSNPMDYYLLYIAPKGDALDMLVEYLFDLSIKPLLASNVAIEPTIMMMLFREGAKGPKLLAKLIYYVLKCKAPVDIWSAIMQRSSVFQFETIKILHSEYDVMNAFLAKCPYYLEICELLSKFGDDDTVTTQIVLQVIKSCKEPTFLRNTITIQQWAFHKFSNQVTSAAGVGECSLEDALAAFADLDDAHKSLIIPAIHKLIVKDFITDKRIDRSLLDSLSSTDLMAVAFKSNLSKEVINELLQHFDVDIDSFMGTLLTDY